MEKKSFILYLDRKKEIDMLSDAKCGVLFKAIFQYVDTGEVMKTNDLTLQVLFSFLTSQIDEGARKWEETRKKRSEAGKLGGRPKKQTKAKKANAFSEKQAKAIESNDKQTKAKKAVTVTVTDTVTTVSDTVPVSDILQDSTAPSGAAQPAEEKVVPWSEIDFELV